VSEWVKSVEPTDEWLESICRCEDKLATQLCDTCKAYMRGILTERERLVKQFPRSLKMMPGMVVVSVKKYREYVRSKSS
jgi:hypothetical protein